MTDPIDVPEETVITPPKPHTTNELTSSRQKFCCYSNCSAKCLQVFVGSSWGFLTNVERAIIMPSLWLYLKTTWNLEAAKNFYAATLAAFCLAILIVTPLIGYAAYKGVRTQVLLLFSNLLEILGNIMYLVGQSPWVLLTGRFISGIGACCDPPLYADMVKLTSSSERTAYVIAMLLPRQAGLLFGPAFTIVVDKMHLSVGHFDINVYNVPGLLMATLWGIHCILVILAYPNMERIVDGAEQPGSESVSKRISRYFIAPPRSDAHSNMATDCKPILDEIELSSEKKSNDDLSDLKSETLTTRGCFSCCWSSPSQQHSDRKSIKPYFTFPLITLYAISFMVNFCTLCLESVLPPVVYRLYSWTELAMSVIYLSAGALVLVTFLVIRCLTMCLSDRTILTSGLIILLGSYLWYACLLAYRPIPSEKVGITLMLCALTLHVVGIPMVATSSESLYSKLAPKQDMDCAQTIFRTVLNVGFFLGPFVGGSITEVPQFGFLLMLLLVFFPFVLHFLMYEAFLPSTEIKIDEKEDVI